MDLMQLRRNLLMMQEETYVKNGLVLWMDGIDKGNVSGSWVDRKSGHEFVGVNNPTFGTNYVELDGSQQQYLYNSTFNTPGYLEGTIEVVTTDYSTGSIVFMPSGNYKMAFGIRANGTEIIWATGTSGSKMGVFSSGAKAFSINNNGFAYNGQSASVSAGNSWSGNDNLYNYIGRRNNSSNYNYLTGKIYAIRIYNRQLTADEMIHNQKIDNKRFNLGLTI